MVYHLKFGKDEDGIPAKIFRVCLRVATEPLYTLFWWVWKTEHTDFATVSQRGWQKCAGTIGIFKPTSNVWSETSSSRWAQRDRSAYEITLYIPSYSSLSNVLQCLPVKWNSTKLEIRNTLTFVSDKMTYQNRRNGISVQRLSTGKKLVLGPGRCIGVWSRCKCCQYLEGIFCGHNRCCFVTCT